MRDFDPCASEFISSGYLARSVPGGVLYDPGALIGAGAGIVGSIMGANSASDAADAQANAAAASDATQRYFYDQTRADNASFRDAGVSANNRLAQLLGLQTGSLMTQDQLRSQLVAQYTKTTPVMLQTQGRMQDTGEYEILPQQYGVNATVDEKGLQAAINQRMTQQQADLAAQRKDPSFGSLTRNFGANDLKNDAVYQSGLKFGLDQGVQALNRQAAAGGNFLSGAAAKALARFGNDYGSTKANESYNRFNNNQNQQYNRLAGLSGAGQQATDQVSAAGSNAGNQISASQQGAGNARASGYLASGNAWQNGLNGMVSALKGGSSSYFAPAVTDGGYSTGTGSAYGGSTDNGVFTPYRQGM